MHCISLSPNDETLISGSKIHFCYNQVTATRCFKLFMLSLKDVYLKDEIEDDHEKALSIISYIGCGVSLVGLALTMISIILLK